MNKIIILFTCVILFFGCSKKREDLSNSHFSAENLKQLVLNAISGNASANDTLSGLFDYSLPLPGEINKLEIDSLALPSGKIYYSVLFETPNPVYNRFAIYDSSLTSYLVDKSLNGNLTETRIDTTSDRFFAVTENFLSKDVLKLERLTLYRAGNKSVVLSFRTFTKFVKRGVVFTQVINEITGERIKSSVKSSKPSIVNNKGDVFIFNVSSNLYLSAQNLFDSFVLTEVQNYNGKTEKPQIFDENSALESVGLSLDVDTIKTAGNAGIRGEYSLTLDETWKDLKNISISSYLKKEFKGSRYINRNIGASIYVIPLEPEEVSETYIDYNLTNTAEGNYMLRFSDKIETAKNYVQFFEYSCGSKKYLMIVETPRFTYDKYKNIYDVIINSFSLDC